MFRFYTQLQRRRPSRSGRVPNGRAGSELEAALREFVASARRLQAALEQDEDAELDNLRQILRRLVQ